MNTSRISLVFSLVLLSSSAFCNRYFEVGEKLGSELLNRSYHHKRPTALFAPEWKEIFAGLAKYEPSDVQFKKCFADLQMACKGLQCSAKQSHTQEAIILKVLAENICCAENSGQVFTQLGMQIKLLSCMPFPYNLPQLKRSDLEALNIVTSDQAPTHILGKAYAQQIFTIIFEMVVSGTTTGINRVTAIVEEILGSIQDYQSPSGFLNAINGFKEGLNAIDLEAQLTNVRPSRAILVRFVHGLLEEVTTTLSGTQAIFKGNEPDINAAINAAAHDYINAVAGVFIKCGRELEAIS